jgi:hypothetical protein
MLPAKSSYTLLELTEKIENGLKNRFSRWNLADRTHWTWLNEHTKLEPEENYFKAKDDILAFAELYVSAEFQTLAVDQGQLLTECDRLFKEYSEFVYNWSATEACTLPKNLFIPIEGENKTFTLDVSLVDFSNERNQEALKDFLTKNRTGKKCVEIKFFSSEKEENLMFRNRIREKLTQRKDFFDLIQYIETFTPDPCDASDDARPNTLIISVYPTDSQEKRLFKTLSAHAHKFESIEFLEESSDKNAAKSSRIVKHFNSIKSAESEKKPTNDDPTSIFGLIANNLRPAIIRLKKGHHPTGSIQDDKVRALQSLYNELSQKKALNSAETFSTILLDWEKDNLQTLSIFRQYQTRSGLPNSVEAIVAISNMLQLSNTKNDDYSGNVTTDFNINHKYYEVICKLSNRINELEKRLAREKAKLTSNPQNSLATFSIPLLSRTQLKINELNELCGVLMDLQLEERTAEKLHETIREFNVISKPTEDNPRRSSMGKRVSAFFTEGTTDLSKTKGTNARLIEKIQSELGALVPKEDRRASFSSSV